MILTDIKSSQIRSFEWLLFVLFRIFVLISAVEAMTTAIPKLIASALKNPTKNN